MLVVEGKEWSAGLFKDPVNMISLTRRGATLLVQRVSLKASMGPYLLERDLECGPLFGWCLMMGCSWLVRIPNQRPIPRLIPQGSKYLSTYTKP